MRTNLGDALVITDQDFLRLLSILDESNAAEAELLDRQLHRAQIVEQHCVSPDVVTMNSEVVYEDFATGDRRTVRIVYPKDADASRGWVSVLAPIGRALLGLKVGQDAEWNLPRGPRRVFVVELRYQPESHKDFHL